MLRCHSTMRNSTRRFLAREVAAPRPIRRFGSVSWGERAKAHAIKKIVKRNALFVALFAEAGALCLPIVHAAATVRRFEAHGVVQAKANEIDRQHDGP